jgi:glycosyltransferase involved in cell wall biosynthesis
MSSEKRPPRIVMIFQSYLPEVGGAQRQFSLQAPFLQQKGYDVQVLARLRPGLKRFEMMGSVPVHRIPAPGPKPIAAVVFICLSLWKIWQLRPDMIHAYELLSPTTIAIFAKRLFRVPLLVKVLRGGMLGDLYKVLRGRGGERRAKWIVNSVDAYAVISDEIDAELAGIGVPEAKRVFIPNGVDLSRFSPANSAQKSLFRKQLNLPDDGTIVIFGGRFEPEKRLDQLLDVWKRIRSRDENAWLVLAGSGSEEKRLREMAGEGVIFPGAVEDFVPYLQSSDIFILPSATEGLSNSLLEAMACGLPPVATNVGGAPDTVTHGDEGLLISPDAPAELEDALTTLLGDAGLRERVGIAARKKIEVKYSLEAVVTGLDALYAKMLQVKN